MNILIEENGLSPVGESKTPLEISKKKSESHPVAVVFQKCGSNHVGKNGSVHSKSRFRRTLSMA
ncbi:MAG: hypothetical protein WCR13_02250 [Sphaerochaeta sp.]